MHLGLLILTFFVGVFVGSTTLLIVILFLTGAYKTEREMERVARRARQISEESRPKPGPNPFV